MFQALVRLDERPDNGERDEKQRSHYWRMWRNTVLAVGAVAVVPLLFMTAVNYYQFQRAFKEETVHPINRLTSAAQHSLESFLDERIGMLRYIVERESFDNLADAGQLDAIYKRMKATIGGFVDVGLIDSEGTQRSYVGPYNLQGKSYENQAWFNEVILRGVHVSDVFLGHRQIPHFVIAVKQDHEPPGHYVLRATIDTDVLDRQVRSIGLRQGSDAFILNRQGVLQTPSRLWGQVLSPTPIQIPANVGETEIVGDYAIQGETYMLAYAAIQQSPFVFVVLTKTQDLMKGWLTIRTEFLGFLAGSVILIVILVMTITTRWVRRIRDADLRREAMLHNAEHTNKMASIGRLAAGVAHEINNPLAIINEKAGLLKDVIQSPGEAASQEKLLKQVDSILKSVERCSGVTRRLLGFAKHMDIKSEPIALDVLIREVLGFLEKEASYRKIGIDVSVEETLPTLESDRGQLQQLFLNLINNAFDAMSDGGRLDIAIRRFDERRLSVTVKDNGCGIPKEDLERIFEPFFTRKAQGTGLGLSISYGIAQKLGGQITVESEVGKGTAFTLVLPIKRP